MKRLLTIAGLVLGITGTSLSIALPASAVSYFRANYTNGSYNNYACNYGANYYNGGQLKSANNNCNVRVWLHQKFNPLGGWAYCISPTTNVNIPARVVNARDIQITSNHSRC
jgi:hypothetical protein